MEPIGALDAMEAVAKQHWATYRTLDPVRAAALAAAVGIVTSLEPRPNESDYVRATRVQHVACMMEDYLTGDVQEGGQ
jgi:hypothetical protein